MRRKKATLEHPWQARVVAGREHVYPIDAMAAIQSKPEFGTEVLASLEGCALCDLGLCRQVVMPHSPESVVHGPTVQP